jgi:hypothetical protein
MNYTDSLDVHQRRRDGRVIRNRFQIHWNATTANVVRPDLSIYKRAAEGQKFMTDFDSSAWAKAIRYLQENSVSLALTSRSIEFGGDSIPIEEDPLNSLWDAILTEREKRDAEFLKGSGQLYVLPGDPFASVKPQ